MSDNNTIIVTDHGNFLVRRFISPSGPIDSLDDLTGTGTPGAQGAQGEPGDQGIPGDTGGTGETGETGDSGADGADGVSITDVVNTLYPVGALYISTLATNPNTILGVGTWITFGAGRVLVGLDSGQSAFDTVEAVGGEKSHTLSAAEMPSHTHVIASRTATTGVDTSYEHGALDLSSTKAEATEVVGSVGGDGAHNNLQPYIVVYMWRRTA